MPHCCGDSCGSSLSHAEPPRNTTKELAECSDNTRYGSSNATDCSDCEHGQYALLSPEGPLEDTCLGEGNTHVESNILPRMTKCSEGICCVRKITGNSNASYSMPNSTLGDVSPLTVVKIGEINGGDLSQMSEIERVIMSVQGMTCTGCERSLQRFLNSINTISNVKTSLLPPQAEFDLRIFGQSDADNAIRRVEQLSGFTCTRVVHLGDELDLFLDPNAPKLGDEWPIGVTDIKDTGENKIRVSFNPKVIGARNLLSHEFLRSASLAPPPPPPMIALGRAECRKRLYATMLSIVLTIPVLVLSYGPLPRHQIIYGGVSCGLATIIQIFITGRFYPKAFKTLIHSHAPDMDMLIILSTSTAYIYSVVAYAFLVCGKPLSTGEFFETSTLLITLIMIGQSAAKFGSQTALESVSMESMLQAQMVTIVTETGVEEKIDSRLLQDGDVFRVHPDEKVVTDGVIVKGETEVDEAMISGEATLICKTPGMKVVAGSQNHQGAVLVQLTHLPYQNTLRVISAMVDEAKTSKPKVEEIADRVAGYIVPLILGITVVVFITWTAIGIAARHQSSTTACINAMTFAISTLIVSCPCAIGLAVPIVVLIAGGVAARHGLIFKAAETIDIARKVGHVIFDKTGTLTQGKLFVTREEYLNDPKTVASMVLGLTSSSKHPVSVGVAAHLKGMDVDPSHVENVVSIPGCGLEALWNGSCVRAGNPHFLGLEELPVVSSPGLTIFCVSVDGALAASFGLQDQLRPDALATVNELKRRSILVSLISGDNNSAVQTIATQLGISTSNVRSRCTPAEKQAYVKEQLLRPNSTVLFCGDGTNDAAALAQASIGMHINEGSDIAQSAADVLLMRPFLKGILTLIDLSKAFHRRVVFNFVWSFLYNVFAILLAAGAFPRGVRIPPQFAGLGELISVLPVILVAMQLRYVRL